MAGVGTELQKMLAIFGKPELCQNCADKARIMDEKGPEWVLENIDTVVRWLVDHSKRLFVSRLIPEAVSNEAARVLVLEAVKAFETTKSDPENTNKGKQDGQVTEGDSAVADIDTDGLRADAEGGVGPDPGTGAADSEPAEGASDQELGQQESV